MLATELLLAHLRATDTSQRQFSKETGLPKSTVGDICAGRAAEISKSTAEILAPLLGRSVAELMGIEVQSVASASEGSASDLQLIPWAEIQPSPLNPRRTFDEEPIRELADSLFEHGQLQNIVVRRVAFPQPNEGKYQLVAGERRWRATGYNIQVLKRWQPGQPMLAKVIEAGDDQHRALALLENLQRVDLTPLEEAEAFKTLTDLKWSTAQIAERIHRTQRFVQQRLSLVTKLIEPARTMLAEGKINIEQARALTAGTEKQQKDTIKKIGIEDHGLQTGADIRDHLLGGFIPVERAIFDRSLYKGEIRIDEHEREYFVNKKAFEALQKQAAKDLAKTKRQEGWSWVSQAQHYSHWVYASRKSTDKKKAGVLIVINWKGEVTVHEGLVKKEGPNAPSRAGSPEANAEQDMLAQRRAEQEAEEKLCEEITERVRDLFRKDPIMALRLKVYRDQDAFDHIGDCLTWAKMQELSAEQLIQLLSKSWIARYEFDGYVDRAELGLLDMLGIKKPGFIEIEDELEEELRRRAEEQAGEERDSNEGDEA